MSGAVFSMQVLAGDYAENVTAQKFFKEMEKRHNFDDSELRKLFSQVYRDQSILDLISKPAEKRLAWRELSEKSSSTMPESKTDKILGRK